jgi:hypothetical protein
MRQRGEAKPGGTEPPSDSVPASQLYTLHLLVERRLDYQAWLILLAFVLFSGLLIWHRLEVALLSSILGARPIPLLVMFCAGLIAASLAWGLHRFLGCLSARAVDQVEAILRPVTLCWIPGAIIVTWLVKGWSWTLFYVLVLTFLTGLVLTNARQLVASVSLLDLELTNFIRHERRGRPGVFASGRYVRVTIWLFISGVLWFFGFLVAVATQLLTRCLHIPFPTAISKISANWIFSVASDAAWRSRRYGSPAARAFMARDRRPPVLLLRSFADDNISAERETGKRMQWFRNATTFEELIADEFWAWGPVVALGRPGESLPHSGAVREYIEGELWQDEVLQLARDAILIVVVLGRSAGLDWELATLVNENLISKTILVVPPLGEAEYVARYLALKHGEQTAALGELLADLPLPGAILMIPHGERFVTISAPARQPREYRESLYVIATAMVARSSRSRAPDSSVPPITGK